MTDPVPNNIWKQIVKYSPLVSVDLVIEHGDHVILGKRKNEPARGEWFVPGGVVRKNESLESAVQRVAMAELGCKVSICTQLGVYDHHYDSSEFRGVDKHYVPIAYIVQPRQDTFKPDAQHASFQAFSPPFSGFHEYVQEYLDDYVSWKSQ